MCNSSIYAPQESHSKAKNPSSNLEIDQKIKRNASSLKHTLIECPPKSRVENVEKLKEKMEKKESGEKENKEPTAERPEKREWK